MKEEAFSPAFLKKLSETQNLTDRRDMTAFFLPVFLGVTNVSLEHICQTSTCFKAMVILRSFGKSLSKVCVHLNKQLESLGITVQSKLTQVQALHTEFEHLKKYKKSLVLEASSLEQHIKCLDDQINVLTLHLKN